MPTGFLFIQLGAKKEVAARSKNMGRGKESEMPRRASGTKLFHFAAKQ